jgi:HlyD family secretion protein
MKINSNSKELFNRLDRIVRARGFSDKATKKHTPRPIQQTKGDPSERPLKLHQRRVTLSRSARKWSRSIVWTLVGLTGFSVAYGMVARIETSVEASGKLEPSEGITKISSPFAALVKEVMVKDGESVIANQPLFKLQDEASAQHLKSLENNRSQVLRDLTITRQRLNLPELDSHKLDNSAQQEADIASQETRLREQINKHEHEKAVVRERGEKSLLRSLEQRASISARTLERLITLENQGAVSALQVDQERQRLLDTEMQLDKQRMLVAQSPSVTKASALKVAHVMALESKDLYERMGKLNHELADVDRQLAEQAKREKLLTVRAPKAGIVFDLAAGSGELASPSTPLLELVPTNKLQARVMIPNKDIGFVKEGMPTEIRIASYPFTEYGSIKGKLIRLAADSKATNPNVPAEHFPAVVELDSNTLVNKGKDLPIKPGMSVTSLIKLGSRPAISLLSDRIVGLFDGVRHIR